MPSPVTFKGFGLVFMEKKQLLSCTLIYHLKENLIKLGVHGNKISLIQTWEHTRLILAKHMIQLLGTKCVSFLEISPHVM